MKDQKILIAIIVAMGVGIAYHLRSMKRKQNLAKANDLKTLEKEVVEENSIVYRNPVQAQYDIVLPHAQVSRKVAEKAKKLTEGRFDIILDRVKQPMYI
jgi:hypothetical protein